MVVSLPGLDSRLAVLLNRPRPRCPALTRIGAPAPIEGQVGLHHVKPPGHETHQLPGPIGLESMTIAESGDESIVAAERADPVFVPRDPRGRLFLLRLHGAGFRLPSFCGLTTPNRPSPTPATRASPARSGPAPAAPPSRSRRDPARGCVCRASVPWWPRSQSGQYLDSLDQSAS